MILWKCVQYFFFIFSTTVELADNNLQTSTNPQYSPRYYRYDSLEDQISLRDKFKILFDGYQKMIDHSFSNSKDLGDMLRFLPGVVVQMDLSMLGMTDLYGIRPDFLKRLESIGLLRPSPQARPSLTESY